MHADSEPGPRRARRLEGKIAQVTGAARGIGAASARRFVAEGARVLLTDADADAVRQAASALSPSGADAIATALDVTSEAAWERAVGTVRGAFGRLDVLVNSAGITLVKTIEETTLEEWRRVLDVNLTGTFLGTKAAIAAMKETGGGSIVNLSSVEGLVGNPHLPAYTASKAGVRLLSKSAALQCARAGYRIRVNSVHPGYIATPMTTDAISLAPNPSALEDRITRAHPLGRLGTADEVASGIVFLASDEASFITGTELVIDGGYSAQ